jgi:hypothetical protein
MKQFKIPIVCTIHHPVSVDRELDIRNAKGWMKFKLFRWYSFLTMQRFVARRMDRILAVADSFDAMTSDRPYRAAMSASKAIAEIQKCAGTQFDPVLVDKFIEILADCSAA